MAGNKFQDFIKKHSGGTTTSSSFSPYQRSSAQDLYNGYAREAEEEENKFQKFIKNHGSGTQQIPQGIMGYRQMQENTFRMQAEQAKAERAARAELLPELEKKKTGELAPASVQEAQARIAELEADVQKMLNTYGSSYYDGSDLSPSAHDNMVRTAQARSAGLKSVMGQESNSYLDATAAEEDPRTRGMLKGTLRTIQNSDAQRAAAEIMDATGWDLDTLNSYLTDAKSVGQFEYDKENGGTFLTPQEELLYSKAKIEALPDDVRKLVSEYQEAHSKESSDEMMWLAQGLASANSGGGYSKASADASLAYHESKQAKSALADQIRELTGWDDTTFNDYLGYAELLRDYQDTEEYNEVFAVDPNAGSGEKALMTVANTATKALTAPFAGGMAALGNIGQKRLEGFGRNAYTNYARQFNANQYAAEQVSENVFGGEATTKAGQWLQEHTGQNAAQFAYGTVSGILDSAATIPTTGLVGFGTNAYSANYREARERGLSEEQAQKYGIASGVAEALIEKIPMDNLVDMARGGKVGKNFVKEWAKQAGLEGSEEVVTSVANSLIDYAVTDGGTNGKTAYQLSVEAHMYDENGNVVMLEEEAKKAAMSDYIAGLATDFAGGAISGGVMGAPALAYGNANANYNKQRAAAIQDYHKDADINTDTEYGYALKQDAERYANNPTQYQADMIDDSTAEGKARKAEVQALAEKEAQGKRLSASDRNYIEESLYVAENAAQQSEASMSAREQYQKYANEMAAVPAEYRTASTSITEDEARAQLGKAAATGNVEAFGEVYQKMKNAKSADLRSKADEIYSSYSGMAQSHGITEQQIAAFKTSAQEAYAAGLKGESRGSMGALSMKAAEAYRAGQQAHIVNKNATVIENKSNLHKANALTKDGKNIVLSGVFSSDGNMMTQDGQHISLSDVRMEDNAIQKVYRFADTLPSVAAKNAYMGNMQDGTTVAVYNEAWSGMFRAGRTGRTFDSVMNSGRYVVHANTLGKDTLRAMYDAGVAQTKHENAVEAAKALNNAFKIKKGNGVFEDARADKSDNINTEVLRVMANITGMNIRLVDDSASLIKDGANAYIDQKNDTVVVGSHASAQVFHEVFGEFTKMYASKEYADFGKAAMETSAEILGEDAHNAVMDSYMKAYGAAGESNTDAEMSDEMTNDYAVAVLSTERGRQLLAKKLVEMYGQKEANSIKDKIVNLYKSIIRSIKSIMQRTNLMGYQRALLENNCGRLEKTAELLIKAFEKAVENHANIEDGTTITGDVAYSLAVDATGRELSEQQQEFFADSKIRDKDGALKVMHHGSIAYGFSVFDIKKAKSAGAYGRGFYFSDSDSHAGQYGKTYDVYLNIVNPVTEGTHDITKEQLRAFVDEIANDDDYGIENYGYGATPASVAADVWGKDDFAMLQDINATCVGDFAEAVKIFNRVNGTTYDGIVAPTETIAFYPNQIKNVDNTDPTNDPDIRFSLDVEANADGYLQLNNPNLNEEEAKTTFKIREAAKGDPYVYLTNANYIQNSTWEALGKIVGMDWKTLKERARAQASGSYGYTFDNSYTAEIMSYLNDRVYFKDTSYIDKELHAEAAEKYFGVTRSFDRAGYLDINGKLLDFSQGQGYRVQDHREISDILDMDDDAGYSDGLIQFMAEGNVRMQSYGIDISMSPNAKQRSVLKDFFRRLGGEVTVDFSAINGDTIGSAEYREGTAPSRILNDIDSFFATGEVPAGNADDLMSFRYSIEVTDDGYKYVNVDVEQAQFDGKSLEEKRALAKKVILDKFARNIIGYKEGAPVVGTARGAKEYAYADKRYYTKEAKNAKMRASTELDSLLDVSKFIEHSDYEEVKERHPEAVGGFDQYKILFKVGDDWYVGIVNVMNQENVRTLYDITKIRSIDQNEISTEVGSLAESSAPMDIISRYLENNKKFSLDVDDTFWDIFGGEELAESASILEEGMEALKHQKVDAAKVRGVAHKIRRDFGSTISLDTLAGNLEKVFAYMQTEDHVNYNDMMRVLDEVATPVIDQATTLEGKEMYDAFVDALKGYSIRLTDTQKQEVISVFGSYGEFRRMMMPINISEKGTADLEMLWNEIAEASGGVLDADTTEGDMPTALYDALSSLRPSPVNNYGGNREAVSKDLAMRIVEEYLAAQSDAKAKAAAEKMRKKNAQYRANLRNNYEKKLKEARADIRNKYYNRGAQMRERNEEKIAQIRAKNRQTATNARRKRLANHEKGMISKQASALMKWLESPTEKHHVPREMVEPVVEFLYALDFVEPDVKQDKDGKWHVRVFNHSVIGEDGSRSMIFDTLTANTREEALQKFYDAIGSGTGSRAQRTWTDRMSLMKDLFDKVTKGEQFEHQSMDDFLQTIDPAMSEEFGEMLRNNRGVAKINLLEYEDLHTINKALRGITHAINQGNKAFTQNATIAEWAGNTMDLANKVENDKEHGYFYHKFMKTLRLDMATPETFLSLNGAEAIYKSLRAAFNTKIADIRQAQTFMQEVMKDVRKKDLRKWVTEIHELRVNGGTLRLTAAQMMSLYELSKRGQAILHMKGGVKADTINVRGKTRTQEKAYHLTDVDIQNIIGQLTEQQKAIADRMQRYMANECAKQGNAAAMTMYGYEKFTEKNYFPISTDKTMVATNNSNLTNETLNAIERSGFTKQVKENASNPILIRDIFDVFTDHATDMATYHGFAPALKDANRWFNFRTVSEEDGWQHWKSIKQAVNTLSGKGGSDYFVKFIKDINGSEKSQDVGNIFDWLIPNYKAAAVGANVRVIIQQPTSYFRAMNVLSPKYLLSVSPAQAIKAGRKMREQSEICWWKSQGYYETSIGKSMKQIVTGQATISEKIRNVSMLGAGLADELTWGTLYGAVTREQKALAKGQNISEEELDRIIKERFDEVVDKTQVVDSTLHRSQYMRSQSGLTKMQTAFMAEPTKSYNMLMEAVVKDYREGTKGRTARAAFAFVFTSAFTAAAAAIVDAFRRDTDDEEWGEVYLEALKENIADNVNPLNMFPVIKDVSNAFIDVTKGESFLNSTGRMDMDAITSLIDAGDTLIKALHGEGNKTPYGVALTMIRPLSQVTGIPAYNLTRDVSAVYNAFFPDLKKSKSENPYAAIYDAIKADRDVEAAVQKAMANGGVIADIQSGITSRYKSDYYEMLQVDEEQAAELAEKARKGYLATGMTDTEFDAMLAAEWATKELGYSILDDAIENGEGVAEAIADLQETKKDDAIVKHIVNSYASTIRYNRENGIDNGIEENVEEALKEINSSYSFDERKKVLDEKAAETAAKNALSAERDGYKQTMYSAIDSGNMDWQQAVHDLANTGMEFSDIKSALTSQYKEEFIKNYNAGKDVSKIATRIATVKAYCDSLSGLEIPRKYGGDYYTYEIDKIKEWLESKE